MPEARHCRHCMGDCGGGCLISQPGRCIHGWNGKHPRQFSWQLLLNRRWWHRVLWGTKSRSRHMEPSDHVNEVTVAISPGGRRTCR
jgi:hypothetical protein